MSLMFRASRFCIRASENGEALARWASGSKTLMLSPENTYGGDSLFQYSGGLVYSIGELAYSNVLKS